MYTPPKFHSGLDIGEALELADVGGGVSGLPAIDASLATGLVAVAASQAEAEAGTEVALRSFSPVRVGQAIAALAAGGRVTSWKTVGGDASDDYATVVTAIAAGEYSLILTSSVTETTGASIPNADINVIFESPSFTWTFNSNIRLVNASYTSAFRVYLNGGTIAWSPSTGSFQPFGMSNAAGIFEIYGGGTLANTATVNISAIAHANLNQGYFGHYKILAPNYQSGGITASTRLSADSLELVGGGPGCAWGINNGTTDKL